MPETKKPVRSNTSETQHAKTTYVITTTFNEDARETLEQKLARLVADVVKSKD